MVRDGFCNEGCSRQSGCLGLLFCSDRLDLD
ncbi:hypothetical protein EII26_12350 [Fretibacterium sp. OH1220_COT-178]|nr:hypothetical protein EII26_12350 [Fretibacterium sp. OH1220_COT-178]